MSEIDSIAAIATAPGRGGIAVIRVSGDKALLSAQTLCHFTPKPRQVYFKKFYDNNEVIDEGVVIYYQAPHSYTGEDVIEFQGHGGNITPQRVLSAVLKIKGIRQAQAGEFTKRAFLNGKMDLTRAEAVEDLISSGTDSAAKAAMASLDGIFAKTVFELNERLTNFRVRIEACLDFPEEHEDFFDSGTADAELNDILKLTQDSIVKANQGIKLQEGARIVLTGEPNAGKSSLLNTLAGIDKAIVTNIPGTTRDILTANIEIAGVIVTITDTAGIRDNPSDEIEAIGIQKAINEVKKADLILLLVDNSKEPQYCLETLNKILDITDNKENIIIVKTKKDLEPNPKTQELLNSPNFAKYKQISCSVKQKDGHLELIKEVKQALDIIEVEGVFSARRRHKDALNLAYQALQRAISMLQIGDLVLCAREITICQNHLGEITGKITSDDILGKIFATFCIGK